MLPLPSLFRNVPRCAPFSARGLTYSNVLSKSWDNNSVSINELRAEAKSRGLSTRGSKSILASRLAEHEKSTSAINMAGSREASTLSSAPTTRNIAKSVVDVVGAREASSLSTTPSSPSANPTKAPGNPEPPVVPTAPYRLEIHLPDLSLRAPFPPVEPPYVPDFWNSSAPPTPVFEEDPLPKVVVVGGAATHHGGGPTHSSLNLQSDEESSPTLHSERSDSFLDDIAEDLGLPPIADRLKKGLTSFIN
ncbi:hypothetical protein HYPSUDRAFT_35232 [Hypholoma sublateritium FD-334 SS-4]|uniref:SAP domain-containing protein n=1 Tax=Hypholoma sublateritium (strain FD-334 SS-4) TaxID=945553 RepID=A0A0D2P8P6_HYPSF|nr:hypothetical protein HYPSUDRAFT_35232 [Hypholoma sublateritium FD-334 SS-4]